MLISCHTAKKITKVNGFLTIQPFEIHSLLLVDEKDELSEFSKMSLELYLKKKGYRLFKCGDDVLAFEPRFIENNKKWFVWGEDHTKHPPTKVDGVPKWYTQGKNPSEEQLEKMFNTPFYSEPVTINNEEG